MSTHVLQIYPSPANCQHTNDDEIDFHTAAVMLSAIVDALPEEERKTARITGWLGLRLVVDHVDSPAEVAAKREAIITDMMYAGARDGLTKDQLADYAKRLAAV